MSYVRNKMRAWAKRNAKRNPLVGFHRYGDPPPAPKAVDVPLRMAYMPNAEERYRAGYARTTLPIRVHVGPSREDYKRGLRGEPGELQLIVPLDIDDEEYETGVGRSDAFESREAYQRARDAAFREAEPGSVFRVTPLTPFNLLHRAGDEVQMDLQWELQSDYALRAKAKLAQVKKEMAQLGRRLSAFVDTQAGRLGVLEHESQALSDLFALRVKTGRIGWKPEAAETERERYTANRVSSLLPAALDTMIELARACAGRAGAAVSPVLFAAVVTLGVLAIAWADRAGE